MRQAISGFFRTRDEAEVARSALFENKFSDEAVSFVAGGTETDELPKIGPLHSTGAEGEAASDAFVGSLIGMAAGIVAFVVPGIGPLVAAGPLAGAIAGATVGGATGGIIGLLRDHGISEDEAEFYARGVEKGGALVTVQERNDERARLARQLLDQYGAIRVENLTEPADRVLKAG